MWCHAHYGRQNQKIISEAYSIPIFAGRRGYILLCMHTQARNHHPNSVLGCDICPLGWEENNVFLMFSVRNAEFIFNLELQTKVYFIIKLNDNRVWPPSCWAQCLRKLATEDHERSRVWIPSKLNPCLDFHISFSAERKKKKKSGTCHCSKTHTPSSCSSVIYWWAKQISIHFTRWGQTLKISCSVVPDDR